MRARAILFAAIALSLGAIGAYWGADRAVGQFEKWTEAKLAQVPELAAHDWSGAKPDGLMVIVTGEAPSEIARLAALEAVGSQVDPRRIIDRITVAAAPDIQDFRLQILRDETALSVSGLIPEGERAQILEALESTTAQPPFAELLMAVPGKADPRWDAARDAALAISADLPRAQILATAHEISAQGFVAEQSQIAPTRLRLKAAMPEGVTLTLALSAPRPAVSPFIFDATGGASLRVAQCTLSTAEDRARILARLADHAQTVHCQLALGSPSQDWPDAVLAVIDALDALEGGRASITDTEVALRVPGTADTQSANRIIDALAHALPRAFRLSVERPKIAEPHPSAKIAVPEMRLVTDAKGITITAPVPSPETAQAVTSYAEALFGHKDVTAELTETTDLPEDWLTRIFVSLDAAAQMQVASVSLRDRALEVIGMSSNEGAETHIRALFAERTPDLRLLVDVTEIAPPPPAPAERSAAECARVLGLLLGADQFAFAPSSTKLTEESALLLDRMAQMLRSCPKARFEIAGYTDSQGREELNLSLSQSRAEAVLDGLLARGVRLAQIEARGYGEANPIADNKTEAGRAANRRIEVTLLEPPQETPEGDGP